MPGRDVVVVGASAGGVEALMRLVQELPAGFPAAVFVVLHVPPDSRSLLARILGRAGHLPAGEAVDGEPIRPGRIFVARPNYHLLVERDRVRVIAGPHENGVRPAVDPLFRSAARAYGERVVGVVLSGTRDDGTAGLQTIKEHGGVAIVQSPQEALFPGMPRSALEVVDVDHCLPAAEIARKLVHLAHSPLPAPVLQGGRAAMTAFTAGAGGAGEPADEGGTEVPGGPSPAKEEGTASGYTCPECHGSLWEKEEGDQVWFECRVSHRYSFQSMLAEQARTVEASIWAAINVLEERAALLRKQSRRAQERGHPELAVRFEEQAQDADGHAQAIRTSLLGLVQSLGEEVAVGDGDGDGDGDAHGA
jgi:two-component system, chemotaxis family, protein-glutamate methylesterase/glutaminase